MTYAEGTSVTVEKSKAELEGLLRKHGAGQRVFGNDDQNGQAFVMFALSGRQYRLEVPLPKIADFAKKPKRGWGMVSRTAAEQQKAHEQACRERWRAVVLLVKAKLELVALGVSSIEREFLADLMLPDGRRVHQAIEEDVAETYATGKMPKLLGMGTGG
jgi:hypothetical protein